MATEELNLLLFELPDSHEYKASVVEAITEKAMETLDSADLEALMETLEHNESSNFDTVAL